MLKMIILLIIMTMRTMNNIVIDSDSLMEISENIERSFYYSDFGQVEWIIIDEFNISITNLTALIGYKKKEIVNDLSNEIHYEGFELIMMYNMTISQKIKDDNERENVIRRTFETVTSFIKDFYLRRQEDNTFAYTIIEDEERKLEYTPMDWLEFEVFQPVLLRQKDFDRMIIKARNTYLSSSLRHYPPNYAEFYFGRFILMIKGQYYALDPTLYSSPYVFKIINLSYTDITKINPFYSEFNFCTIEVEYLLKNKYQKIKLNIRKIGYGKDEMDCVGFDKLDPHIPNLQENLVTLLKNEANKFNHEQKYLIPIW